MMAEACAGIGRGVRIRMAILIAVFGIGAAALIHQSYELGVVKTRELRSLGEDQWLETVKISARRGAIFDRNGAELAVSIPVDSIYVNPRRIENASTAAAALAGALGMDAAEIEKRISSKTPFVWIKRQVTPAEADKARGLGIPGVETLKETKRYYPNRELAAHLLGFVGVDGEGLDGMEKSMDPELRGEDDALRGVRDATGTLVFIEKKGKNPTGTSLVLTIDKTLQYLLEHELALAVRTFEARSGTGVMVDPSTGEVLAMANVPTYNPNDPSEFPSASRRNRALTDVVEPGSTFKIFTISAALNAGVVRPDEQIDYPPNGAMQVADVTIHDAHPEQLKSMSITQVIARSSNIGMAKIALRVGSDRLYRYIKRFGFGEKTGVSAPYEAPGILRTPDKWHEVELATIGFGQGISVSAMQLAMGLGAIANQGMLMEPRLVRRIVDNEGRLLQDFPPRSLRRVVNPDTAKLVTDIMTAVTEEGGTGTEAAMKGFLVAGKTGTAQKASPSGGYDAEKRVALFIGFVPANAPRLALVIIIDEPAMGRFGGVVAAPVFRRVADQALKYLGVAPSLEELGPSYIGLGHSPAEQEGKPEPTGSEAGPAPENRDVVLAPDEMVIPDLRGMSILRVLNLAREQGFKVVPEGSGAAMSQSAPPGTVVKKGSTLNVAFASHD